MICPLELDGVANVGTDSTYMPGRAAAIYLNLAGEPTRIGTFGVLHPNVLKKFELPFPTSTLELNVEVFL
jgi:phenylalanyl-tRNA synthetase beta chain